MVGELGDLRLRAPWCAADISMPLVAGSGERARPHHREGMARLASEVPGAVYVELPGCGHDAPTAAPDLVVDRIVLPLLDRCGW